MSEHVEDRTASPVSDYDRIGGASAVSVVVNNFYEKVVADPQLSDFFTQVDMPRLKRHQVLLISYVLGGPAKYDGRELRDAHADLPITAEHFKLVVAHLVAALEEAGVPEEIIGRLGDALAGTEQDIVKAGAS
jgi:hemoglobin